MKKVYASINKVMLAMSKEGISKDQTNKVQGYKFRGIDDVMNSLSPHLAANNLIILPRVIDRQVVEQQSKSGGLLFYVTLKVEFDFINSEDDSIHTVVVFGESQDSGDKATNKALSAALKYACLQSFMIPISGDNDADFTTHEVVAKTQENKASGKPVEQKKETKKPESNNSSDYILPKQAGTYAGKRLGHLQFSEIEACLSYWEKRSEDEGKAPSGALKEMMGKMEEELKKDTQSLITTSDVPF